MTKTNRTIMRGTRFTDDEWQAACTKAKQMDMKPSTLMRVALMSYVLGKDYVISKPRIDK